MAYLFDTNIFIRSKNEMPMDIWPTFWERFREMVNSGEIFTSVTVKDEIDKGKKEGHDSRRLQCLGCSLLRS